MKMFIVAAAVLCALLVWAPPSPAQAKETVRINVRLAPRKFKSVRLRHTPAGAAVEVKVRSSGQILVSFVSQADLRRRPEDRRPLFEGLITRQVSFSVTIPEAGTYFLLLVNRSPAETRSLTVTLVLAPRGISGQGPPKTRPPSSF